MATIFGTPLIVLMVWFGICEGIEIIANPENATVYAGELVYFRCLYTGTTVFPFWRINGNNHGSNTLPSGYHSTMAGLYLNAAHVSMNNTKYVCFFSTYIGGGQFQTIESNPPAYLIVRNPVAVSRQKNTPEVTSTLALDKGPVLLNSSLILEYTSVYDPIVHTKTIAAPMMLLTHVKDSASTTCTTRSCTEHPHPPPNTTTMNQAASAPVLVQNSNSIILGISCTAAVVIILVMVAFATFFFLQSRNNLKKTSEDNYNMKQNAAYEQTCPRAKIPVITNEAYGISPAATGRMNVEAYASTTVAGAVGEIQPTTDSDVTATVSNNDHSNIDPYATTTVAINEMAAYMEAYATVIGN